MYGKSTVALYLGRTMGRQGHGSVPGTGTSITGFGHGRTMYETSPSTGRTPYYSSDARGTSRRVQVQEEATTRCCVVPVLVPFGYCPSHGTTNEATATVTTRETETVWDLYGHSSLFVLVPGGQNLDPSRIILASFARRGEPCTYSIVSSP
jgi:hypothetical protein